MNCVGMHRACTGNDTVLESTMLFDVIRKLLVVLCI